MDKNKNKCIDNALYEFYLHLVQQQNMSRQINCEKNKIYTNEHEYRQCVSNNNLLNKYNDLISILELKKDHKASSASNPPFPLLRTQQ